jgi:lactate dehydrogenase-like 2-hydroxyacid dehydrogenase
MAVGYNNFDVDAMTAAGVQCTNYPLGCFYRRDQHG